MSLSDRLKGACKKISEILNYDFTPETRIYGTLGGGYHIMHKDGTVEQIGDMGPFPLATQSEKKLFKHYFNFKKINYKA